MNLEPFKLTKELELLPVNQELVGPLDFAHLMRSTRINLEEELPAPPVAISIGSYHYKGDIHPIPFGTYGNFSCLVGASKSMKTFLKSALVSAYLGGRSTNYFGSIRGHHTEGKLILDVDTEQSDFHVQRVGRRTIEMVGALHPGYRCFSLRELDAQVRLEFVEHLIMDAYRGRVGLVALDGVADLMEDVNDLKEANRVVQKLMRWTSEGKCHILTILHRNHGSDKPTGHLGSAVMKKAETVAFVERNEDTTRVTANYTRNYPFPEFSFRLNSEMLPEEVESLSKSFMQ